MWGIRVMTIAQAEALDGELQRAMAVEIGDCSKRIKRKSWARFLQAFFVSRSPAPGITITVRRALGMYDYSVFRIKRMMKKRLFDMVPPVPAVDAIVCANYDIETLIKLLEKGNEEEQRADDKKKDDNPSSWGEVMASYFINAQMLPCDFFSMTLTQLDVVGEYSEDEEERSRWETVKNKAQSRVKGNAPYGTRQR